MLFYITCISACFIYVLAINVIMYYFNYLYVIRIFPPALTNYSPYIYLFIYQLLSNYFSIQFCTYLSVFLFTGSLNSSPLG